MADTDYRVSYIGDFREFSFGEVLYSLACRKENGALYVQQEGVIKKIYFSEGEPIFVESGLARESLLRFVWERRGLGKNKPLEFLQEIGQLDALLMPHLVQKGLISPHEVALIVSELFAQRILECFRWEDGEYFFLFDENPPDRAEQYRINVLVYELIHQGIQVHYTFERLKNFVKEFEDRRPVLAAEPYLIITQLKLKGEEAKIVRAIDGKTNFIDIAFSSTLDMEQALSLLVSLKILALLVFPEDPPRSNRLLTDLNDEEKRFADDILLNVPLMLEKNPFQMLQISRSQNLTDEEVRRGYYALAQHYHRSGIMERMPAEVQVLSKKLFERASNFFEAVIRWVKAKDAGRVARFFEAAAMSLTGPVEMQKMEAVFLSGTVRCEQGDTEKGLEDLYNVMKMRDFEGEYRARFAIEKFKTDPMRKDSFKETLTALRRAIDHDRYYVGNYLAMGCCYELMGEMNHANHSFGEALAMEPHNEEARLGALRTLTLSQHGARPERTDPQEAKKRLESLAKYIDERQGKTNYEVLGLDPSATVSEIKKAYFSLAKEFHPDTLGEFKNHPTAVHAFVMINEAYDILASETKRRIYDRTLRAKESLKTQEAHEKRIRVQQKLMRAKVLIGNSDFENALSLLQDVIQAVPDDREAMTHMAWVRYMLEMKFDQNAAEVAESTLSELAKKHSDYEQPLFYLGKIALREEKFTKAEHYFRGAQIINPTSVEINREIRLLQQRLATLPAEPAKATKKEKEKSAAAKKGLFGGIFGAKK